MRSALLIGAGRSHRLLNLESVPLPEKIVTLDINPDHTPDVLWDLNVVPWPFEDESFDEIHAYEVLEHLGSQGDAKSFFETFSEIHRILKKGGILFGSCPNSESAWLLAEPSHRRVILPHTFNFLSQKFYDGVGKTASSDFRNIWKGNLEYVWIDDTNKTSSWFFALMKLDYPREE